MRSTDLPREVFLGHPVNAIMKIYDVIVLKTVLRISIKLYKVYHMKDNLDDSSLMTRIIPKWNKD